MKKVIWIIIVVLIGGYFFNSYTESKAKQEAKRAEANRIKQATKTAVSQMVSRTNAVNDWEASLRIGDKYYRFGPILTVELERVWLQQQPILFIGAIKDIATHDESNYLVLVEQSFFGRFKYKFGTELQLSILSSKGRIDEFLKQYPDQIKYSRFKNGVAVVARINSIRTTYIPGDDGEREEVKIGNGELVDIAYTGNVRF